MRHYSDSERSNDDQPVDYRVLHGTERGRIRYRRKADFVITRDWLNTHIPVDEKLRDIAAKALGAYIGRPVENFDDMPSVLVALADLVEKERFFPTAALNPEWMQPDHPDYEHEWSWNVSIRGLDYKESMSYLTAEGWPCGTKCWFMTVDFGWKEYIAHETPLGALYRTIVVVSACLLSRQQPPKKRKKLVEYIKQVMETA